MADRADHDVVGKPTAGSLAEMVTEAAVPTFGQSFPPATCAKVVVLAILFVWLNWFQLPALGISWMKADWSHGPLIPLFSLYLLYARRDELLAAPRQTCLWGLPILLWGIFQVLVGVYPLQNLWISHLGMVPIIFGLVLYLGGRKVIRVTWLPIVFLVFAMPISSNLYEQIARPLQNLAASASQVILHACGVQITVEASSLTIVSVNGRVHPLLVAEACSGMRMLVAFLALGVAMAYLDDRPVWQRVTLVLMAIPIAILCNVLRVVITGTMFVLDRPDMGEGFMHTFTGILMLPPALLLLWGLSRLLRALFVDEDEDEDQDGEDQPAAQGAKP
jgi:exosortase